MPEKIFHMRSIESQNILMNEIVVLLKLENSHEISFMFSEFYLTNTHIYSR